MLAFAALLVSSVRAQQTQPTTYAGYEGQTVVNIDIAASAATDIVSVRKLIVQQQGQPFAMAAIQKSVNALRDTKSFAQIQVSIEPEQKGLRVLFILQPADYIGAITFPGANGQFTYVRLLQAANIPDRSPYVDSLVPPARQALESYLRESGYFLASVRPEIQRDESHRVVNIAFHCDLKRRAKVGDIDFDGFSEAESESLRKALRSPWARIKGTSLQSGKTYQRARIEKSLETIRNRLTSEGRLAPVVRFPATSYDPDTNRASLVFHVEKGPLVSVDITGARVSKRTIRRLIPIYDENSVDRDLVDEGERNLTSYLQSKGFFDAKVGAKLETGTEALRVSYTIEPGKRHKVEGVYLQGNRSIPDEDLKSHIFVHRGFSLLGQTISRGNFSADLVRKSVQSIASFYKNAGFSGVAVTPVVKDYDPEVDVTFQISEGIQDRVNSLRIESDGPEASQAPWEKRPLNLHQDSPYSAKLLEDDRNRIIAAYLNLGFLNADLKAAAVPTSNDPHRFDVTYTVREGPQAHIQEIDLLGEEHTRKSFVEKIVSADLRPGAPLSEGQLLTAESNLYNLGIFDWASVNPLRPIVDQTQEEVLVKVHEAKRNTIDVGGGIEVIPRSGNIPVGAVALPGIPAISLGSKFTTSQKSFVGPRFSLDFARHNILGKAQTASIGIVASRLDQRIALTYANPHLSGSSWSSLFSVSAERTSENPIYTATLGQGSFQVEKALDPKHATNVIVRYSFQRTNLNNITIPNLVLPQDQHVRLSTMEVEYLRDTRDNPLDAHHGIYQSFDLGVTPKALGSQADFVRFLGQTAFYAPIRPWLTFANNVRLGLAKPFPGSDVPLSQEFFSGGADSIRGFPINGAGPQRAVTVCGNPADSTTCTLISVPSGGNMLFIINSELRFPIPIKPNLGGAVFYDGGNVYRRINFSEFLNNYTSTIGFGLRYRTPVGPIRFDIGHRLTSVGGVNANQYFVTVGQAF